MEEKDSPKNWRDKLRDIKREYWTENRTVRSLKHKTDPLRRGFSKYVVTPVKKVGGRLAKGAKSIWYTTKLYGKEGIGKVKKVSKRIKKSAGSGWKKFKDLTDLDLLELNIRETDWPAYRAKKWETLKAKARQFPGKVYDEAEDIGQRLGELKENVSKRISSWRQKREDRRREAEILNSVKESGGLRTTADTLSQNIDFAGVKSKPDALDDLDSRIAHVYGHGFKKSKKRSKPVKKSKGKCKGKTKRKVKKTKSKTKRKVKKSKRKSKSKRK